MKAFWVLVGVLMLGAVAYLVAASREQGNAGVMPVSGSQDVAPEAVDAKPLRDAQSRVAPEPVPAPLVAPAVTVNPELPVPATKAVAAPAGPGHAGARAETPRLTEEKPKPTAAPKATPVPEVKPASAETKPADAAPAADPLAAKIVTKDDGSLVVDGKFVLKGKGTSDDPYKVTWDQLLSAQDDYVPKEGRKKVPGRISMLDGQWVEVSGYIAFPVMAESQDEALAMMNQWDGCCIGVPPTPYDAIEVRLKRPAEGNDRLTTYGSMKGKFKVDPHLVGGWLVGLYVMDSASMKPQSYGGFSP